MNGLYLGIDGGQSSTVAMIAAGNGAVLGVGRSGPCNHLGGEAGRAKFCHAVEGCLSEACRCAGLSHPVEFTAACLGFSGGAGDKEAYSRELIRAREFYVTNDAEIALMGATAGEPGIIVIAGTGSIAFGKNAAGRMARAGGWGYIYGDEGGAFDIVRKAARAALRREEGWGPDTVLLDRLTRATQSRDANEMIHRFYTTEFPRDRVAALAPVVTEAAEAAGDAVARTVLENAADDLILYARGVYQTLFAPALCPVLSYIGGVWQSAPVRTRFIAATEGSMAEHTTAPRFNPAAGAVLMALRLAGNTAALQNVTAAVK